MPVVFYFQGILFFLTDLNQLIIYNVLIYYNVLRGKKKECRNKKSWEEVIHRLGWIVTWISLKLGPGRVPEWLGQ